MTEMMIYLKPNELSSWEGVSADCWLSSDGSIGLKIVLGKGRHGDEEKEEDNASLWLSFSEEPGKDHLVFASQLKRFARKIGRESWSDAEWDLAKKSIDAYRHAVASQWG